MLCTYEGYGYSKREDSEMILTILKWIGIGLLIWVILRILKNIILMLLYKFNKNYRDYCDCINAKQLIQEVAERKQVEEQQKQEKLGMLISQWTQTAQYYYFYYEKGIMMPDYAYLLDLLTQQIISMLGGNYSAFRNQITELLKGKDVKDGRIQELTDKGISPLPKDLKPRDFEKRNMTDDDINKLLDDWQKKFGQKPEDKKDEQP